MYKIIMPRKKERKKEKERKRKERKGREREGKGKEKKKNTSGEFLSIFAKTYPGIQPLPPKLISWDFSITSTYCLESSFILAQIALHLEDLLCGLLSAVRTLLASAML